MEEDTRGLALVANSAERCCHRMLCLACYARLRYFVSKGGGVCPHCRHAVSEYRFCPLLPEEQALMQLWLKRGREER